MNYLHNPKFVVEVGSYAWIRIRIHSADTSLKINASLFDSPFKFDENMNWDFFNPGSNNIRVSTKMNGSNIDYIDEAWGQISEICQLNEGTYILIPSTLDPNCFGNFRRISLLLGEYKVTLYVQKGTQIRVK